MDREQPNSRFFKDTSHLPGPIPSPSGQAVSGSRPCCSLDECSFSESLCKNVLSRVCHSVCDLFFKAERTKVKTRVLMGKQIASPDSTSLSPAQTMGCLRVGHLQLQGSSLFRCFVFQFTAPTLWKVAGVKQLAPR